jgi:hypothetical protein
VGLAVVIGWFAVVVWGASGLVVEAKRTKDWGKVFVAVFSAMTVAGPLLTFIPEHRFLGISTLGLGFILALLALPIWWSIGKDCREKSIPTYDGARGWIDYSKWKRLPGMQRTMYLAGAFDSFSANHASDPMAYHYHMSMYNGRMNLQQFSDHVWAYAQTPSDFQTQLLLERQTMQAVMINCLIPLYGKPPSSATDP